MTTIQIDYDNNVITATNDEFKNANKFEFRTNNTRDIQAFLEELFNLMDISEAIIYKQSDGKISTVEEW